MESGSVLKYIIIGDFAVNQKKVNTSGTELKISLIIYTYLL